MENPSLYLYDYHVWANQRWFDHLKKLPGELWHREMTSVFPSISQVFAHIYIVDHMWFAGMSGKSFEESRVLGNRLTDEMKGISLEEMEERFARLSEQYRSFLREQQDGPIPLKHPHYGETSVNLSDLVRPVVNHGTYHRGNLTAMLRQAGYQGVGTDYIIYLYSIR